MKIEAPFTEKQVLALNHYQEHTLFHPFTCGGEKCERSERDDSGVLIANLDSWICPCGSYTQNWAHSFMAEPGDDA